MPACLPIVLAILSDPPCGQRGKAEDGGEAQAPAERWRGNSASVFRRTPSGWPVTNAPSRQGHQGQPADGAPRLRAPVDQCPHRESTFRDDSRAACSATAHQIRHRSRQRHAEPCRPWYCTSLFNARVSWSGRSGWGRFDGKIHCLCPQADAGANKRATATHGPRASIPCRRCSGTAASAQTSHPAPPTPDWRL